MNLKARFLNSDLLFSSSSITVLSALSETDAPLTIGIVIENGFTCCSLDSKEYVSLIK
jgi:hypothetical protein